ncbi:type II secretion system protein [Ferrimonas balearica]|uniref:type II secretion system protein n=1 Tax=Ferrimonas balearica TaxID=44012 RepID=UPI001C99359A|nr:type II secretion system protein [Ferrimonas balearica]MBY5922501.1 type II secretion system GspH family protein [Ferrimonas balearica]MBY5995485.1 type II secretion system GspH family protein [Ferrimonas balearica]
MTSRFAGFTLVELVTIIILVAILSLYALSRFLGPSQFATYATRDALVAEMRRLQQGALAGQSCTLSVTPTQFSLTGPCAGENPYPLERTTVSLAGSQTFILSLDGMGRPQAPCAGGCDLAIGGEAPQTVRIESEGYIHGL